MFIYGWEWRGDPLQCTCVTLFFFFLSWLLIKIIFWKPPKLIIRESGQGHSWFGTDFIDKPTYCNNCKELFVTGHSCDSCGVYSCSEERCIDQADEEIACKSLFLSQKKQMKHHWIRGNLPLCKECVTCGDFCGREPKLMDIRCVWCQVVCHDDCSKPITSCDLGKYQKWILPPTSITLKSIWVKGVRKQVVRDITTPSYPWQPLLVLANRKSGNNQGQSVLQIFRHLLNPAQVVDICEVPPEAALDICRLSPTTQYLVLVCGGDGTVGWVLGAIDKMKLQTRPLVCVLPLGTGNDFARSCGWGSGYAEEDMSDILWDISRAQTIEHDRWSVNIRNYGYFGIKRPMKTLIMNCYFSIGCDAAVVLNFHKNREENPSLFKNRLLNKAWYLGYGTKDVFESVCHKLNERIAIELDGRAIELPELEGIVLLNIGSWSSGCDMWAGSGLEELPNKQSPSDGLIEVCGLYSSLHVGRLQVGLADPCRLGQAKTVRIVVKSGFVPAQCDGEPWDQSPCIISVSAHTPALIMRREEVS
ncbi:diacylglycerol kinase epsilon-like [Bolinopsis microptera]|uniref:diacylglycerol kinase epsilon-like n=1 Tax=Bolinopsis microptera TaxID=2820187 RepID=UPI0030798C7A